MTVEISDREIFEGTMNSCMEMKTTDLEKFMLGLNTELLAFEGGKFLEAYMRRAAAMAAYEKRTHITKEVPENRHNEIMQKIQQTEEKMDTRLEQAFRKSGLPGSSSLFKQSMIYMLGKYEQRLAEGRVRRLKHPTGTVRKNRRRPR